MKKKNLLKMMMTLAFATTMTACSIGDDETSNNNSAYLDNVAVVTENGTTYFIGSEGEKFIPSPAFVNSNNIECGFIQFRLLKDMSSTTSGKQYSIQLIYGPTDTKKKMLRAATVSKLDSTKNDSIIGINTMQYINNRYLTLGINYLISQKYHYFTLCYAEDKGYTSSGNTATPDTVKFILRHNDNKDVATTTTSSQYYTYQGRPDLYFMSYDIASIMNEVRTKNGGKKIYIDIQFRSCPVGSSYSSVQHIGTVQ